jgi:tetratricopeptide (TPR) repeat protein
MIGNFEIDAPPVDGALSEMVESQRWKTGQEYAAILFFGLWGTLDCSPEVRLYAGYRHLADNPEDGPAWLEVSRVHVEADQPEAAGRILDELLRLESPGLYPQLYSEDPDVHRAYLAAETGDPRRALEIFGALEMRHGDSPVYHYLVATLLQELGEYAGAVAAYDQASSALDAFRKEAEADCEAGELDFPAATEFIRRARAEAARGGEFFGGRPLDLSGFRED